MGQRLSALKRNPSPKQVSPPKNRTPKKNQSPKGKTPTRKHSPKNGIITTNQDKNNSPAKTPYETTETPTKVELPRISAPTKKRQIARVAPFRVNPPKRLRFLDYEGDEENSDSETDEDQELINYSDLEDDLNGGVVRERELDAGLHDELQYVMDNHDEQEIIIENPEYNPNDELQFNYMNQGYHIEGNPEYPRAVREDIEYPPSPPAYYEPANHDYIYEDEASDDPEPQQEDQQEDHHEQEVMEQGAIPETEEFPSEVLQNIVKIEAPEEDEEQRYVDTQATTDADTDDEQGTENIVKIEAPEEDEEEQWEVDTQATTEPNTDDEQDTPEPQAPRGNRIIELPWEQIVAIINATDIIRTIAGFDNPEGANEPQDNEE